VGKKKIPVRWDKEALEDLRDIYSYIKKESSQGAETVKKEFIRLARTLSTLPEKFPKEPLLEDEGNFRFIPKWDYKLIYEVTSKEIIIAAIFHTSQHPAKLIKKK
jgi:toxin ParE1/3/4